MLSISLILIFVSFNSCSFLSILDVIFSYSIFLFFNSNSNLSKSLTSLVISQLLISLCIFLKCSIELFFSLISFLISDNCLFKSFISKIKSWNSLLEIIWEFSSDKVLAILTISSLIFSLFLVSLALDKLSFKIFGFIAKIKSSGLILFNFHANSKNI